MQENYCITLLSGEVNKSLLFQQRVVICASLKVQKSREVNLLPCIQYIMMKQILKGIMEIKSTPRFPEVVGSRLSIFILWYVRVYL